MDKLTDVKGIGQALERQLVAAGIKTLEDLAALDADRIAVLDETITPRGRFDWNEFRDQARKLVGNGPAEPQSEPDGASDTSPKPKDAEAGAGDTAGPAASGANGTGDGEANGAAGQEPSGATPEPARTDHREPGGRVIEVTCQFPRRRAGRAFGPTPVRIPVTDLSAGEFEAIAGDPHLSVTG